jgi:hypothetical protein
MIIRGYAVEEKKGNHRADFLSNGREIIKKFPTLFQILGDFPDYDEENYDSNIFLILASTSKYDVF